MATLVSMEQNRHKRKYSIDNMVETLFFPFCGFVILYCLVEPLISTFEYIRAVQYFILVVAVAMFILNFIRKDTKSLYKEKKEWTILKWIFFVYFFVYYVFQLYTMSVFYNYLVVLLYGLVVGYRLRKS